VPNPFRCPHCAEYITNEQITDAVRVEFGPYKVVRFYRDYPGKRRTLERGLTLSEAQARCKDPESSSSTCTKRAGKHRTKVMGPWFDGYTRE
jgi:hypothetical protein